MAALAFSSCDRSDLSSGKKLSASTKPPSGGGNPPPPPPGDCPTPPLTTPVKLNEIVVRNVASLEDESGNHPPWIELYNNSDAELDFGGVALTDDLSQPEKWKVPCIEEAVVPPRGFLVIFADGDTENPDDLHASILLEPRANTQLMLNKGADIVFLDLSRPQDDESLGRYPDAVGLFIALERATPGETNVGPAAPPEVKEAEFIRGDADDSGRLSIGDMTVILQTLFSGRPSPACRDRLDANDDGAVTMADALYVGAYLFQRGASIPPPFPQKGLDPTSDALPCPLP